MKMEAEGKFDRRGVRGRAGAGRKKEKVEVNLSDPQESAHKVLQLGVQSNALQPNIVQFSNLLRRANCKLEISNTEIWDVKLNLDQNQQIFNILESIKDLDVGGVELIISELFSAMEDKLFTFFQLYERLQIEEQVNVFSTMGRILNESLWKSTNYGEPSYSSNTHGIDDLIAAESKEKVYNNTDPRLKEFIEAITEVKKHKGNEKERSNFKYNMLENLQKARNRKYVSKNGLKEMFTTYLASGKNVQVEQIMRKQGAKGSKWVCDVVWDNSVSKFKVTLPKKVTVFLSFDNIQKMLMTHRLGAVSESKPLVVVVTSALATLPEGENTKSEIQYESNNSPANWLHKYSYNSEKKCTFQS